MLVLSRRPGERILFPSAGISVEIIKTRGNTVRVGIEAPEDIRVLRGELHYSSTNSNSPIKAKQVISNQTDLAEVEEHDRLHLCQRMDEIGLALALAQNQQRQGLSDHVDVALDQAIDRLNELKQMFEPAMENEAAVCESGSKYKTRRAETLLELFPQNGTEFRMEFEFAI